MPMEREVFRNVRELLQELTVPELSKVHSIIHELGIFSDKVEIEKGEKVALDLIRIMKDACGVNVASPERTMYVHLCRLCVAEDLLDLKYSLISIGKVLYRDHSTISYYARIIRDIREHPSMYPDYYEIKDKYQKQKDKYGYHSFQDLDGGAAASEGEELQT